MQHSSRNSRLISASAEKIYHAFTNPESLAVFLAPGDMTGKVHSFDLRVGGGYQMSLFYPESDNNSKGKTSGKEDRFTARFLELIPGKKIVEAVTFQSDDPAFAGEMVMEVILKEQDGKTNVDIMFENIPVGIRPEDNEEGTELTLDKLARYVE